LHSTTSVLEMERGLFLQHQGPHAGPGASISLTLRQNYTHINRHLLTDLFRTGQIQIQIKAIKRLTAK